MIDTQRALAAAEARRDALQQALGQSNTPSLRQQLEEATEEVEELQELLGVRAKRFAAGRPVTMTQGYAAYLRVHGIPRQRHASFSPQVTTPQSGSGPDDGLHEELYGGRMLPENKQALDRLYDAKQTQAEFTGRALLDPETTRLRPKDAMQFWTAAKNQPKPTPRPQVTEQKSEVWTTPRGRRKESWSS